MHTHTVTKRKTIESVSDLKNCDNGPEQRVKVLPVRHGVSCFCLQAKFTTKYVHPKDTAKQEPTQCLQFQLLVLLQKKKIEPTFLKL